MRPEPRSRPEHAYGILRRESLAGISALSRTISFIAVACLLAACAPGNGNGHRDLDAVAEDYVKLVLAAGRHDEHLVDAYHGPAAWRETAEKDERGPEALQKAATWLREEVRETPVPDAEMSRLRRQYLDKQLTAVITRLDMIQGENLSFDQESRLLYDSVAPRHDAAHFDAIRGRISKLVPGDRSLADRVEALRQRFVIPDDRLEAVFTRAIEACRERTLQYLDLPDKEDFAVEYVNDKPWSGYNWYQGDSRSLIQLNTDLPIFLDRAVDLGCHEGYPGHHTYNLLLERELLEHRNWVEFSVYVLFSPQSLIAEGSANYGIEMAFPDEQRYEFERDVLMPIAGIEGDDARRYWEVRQALKELDYAGNEAARQYLNGEISREEAANWLVRYTLVSRERADQRVDFFDTYRSYVINYNHGRDMVRDYVERHSNTGAERWRIFGELLGSPRLPGDLATAGQGSH